MFAEVVQDDESWGAFVFSGETVLLVSWGSRRWGNGDLGIWKLELRVYGDLLDDALIDES